MKTIAAELSLNESAVSRALSGKDGVSETTRRRVMAAALQLGYRSRLAAVPKPLQIVLMVEERTMREKDFWSHVMNGLVSEVPVHQGFLSIAVTDASSPVCTLPPLLQQVGQVDGAIAMHATDIRAIQALKRLGIPIVLLDYLIDCPGYDSVIINDRDGTFVMAMEMIRLGHRRFGFVGGLDNASFRMRYEGLVSALIRTGIAGQVPPHWFYPQDVPGEGLPTALFCCNDDNAIRTIEHLQALGIRVPDDVSVIGFDDNPSGSAANYRIPLTTLRVDREELGCWAVRTLVQRLYNPDGPPIQIAVDVKPVIRESSGKPRQEGDS